MANLENVKDAALRTQLDEANQHLRKGKPTEAVHACVDAFMTVLKMQPPPDAGANPVTVPGGRGRRRSIAMGWPNLGANLSMQSVREGNPQIEFKREKFAMSEAITYYEFTVEAAIAVGKAADGNG